MGLHVVLAGIKPLTVEKLCTQFKRSAEVEHFHIASTVSELVYLLSSQHVDLLFIHQSLFQVDAPLPPFVVVGETPDTYQVRNAFTRGAKGYILEDVPEGGLGFIVQAVAQEKDYKFFLNADTTYELLREITNTFASVADISNLTSREQEVLYLLHDGLLNKDIEKQFCISDATVRTYVRSIEQKLNVTRYQILKLWLPKRPTNSPPSHDRKKRTE